MLNVAPVWQDFLNGLFDHRRAYWVIQWEIIYDFYFGPMWSESRKRNHDVRWDLFIAIVRTIVIEGETLPFLTSEDPVSHLVHSSLASWCCGRQFAQLNDFYTPILDSRHEIILNPFFCDYVRYLFCANHCISDIWVYGVRRIAPHYYPRNVCNLWFSLLGQNRISTVMVKPRECRKILSWDTFSVVTANQASGVRREAHNQIMTISTWVGADCFCELFVG